MKHNTSSTDKIVEDNLDNMVILRQVCQDGFLEFCMAIRPDFLPTKFHSYLCNKLQSYYEAVRDGKDVRSMVEVQPQIGKSSVVSELFPAWILGKSHIDGMASCPIICASYGASLAEQKSANTRDYINHPMYSQIFPGVRLNPDSTAKDYWKTNTGGSYKAVGVGGPLTGFPGKFILVDDPIKDRADADSDTIRESTWSWFQSTLQSRKQDVSGIIVINTRWHMGDVSGMLLAKQEEMEAAGVDKKHYDQWERLRFPAIAEEDEYLEMPNGEKVLFRKAGEVLCPERFSHDSMIKTKNNVNVYEWSSLYQQSPILSENQEFKEEWFQYYEESDLDVDGLRHRMLIYVMVDLAISQKKEADSTSIITIGQADGDPNVYILDEHTGHFDPSEVIEYLFYLRSKYGLSLVKVGIESVGYQASLSHFVQQRMSFTGQYFTVEDLKAQGSAKSERIRGLIPRFKNGTLFMRQNMVELQRELLQFPKGRHDDRIDALSYMNQLLPISTIRKIAQQFIPQLRRY